MIGQLARRHVAEPQIVFITSISSTFASVNRAEYCVAKAGLSMVGPALCGAAGRAGDSGLRDPAGA